MTLVKGIHFEEEMEEVKKYFEDIVGFAIAGVRRFQQGEPEKITRKLHWWVLTCNTRAEVMLLKEVKEFYGGRIHWEPYIAKGPMRCFKCQEWNHMARNCLGKVKCPRCAGHHQAEDCALPMVTKDTTDMKAYTCSNCNTKGHWVNSDNCPFKARATVRAAQIAERRGGYTSVATPQERMMQQQVPMNSDFGEFRPVGRRNQPVRATVETEAIQRTGSSYANVLKSQVSARGARPDDGGGFQSQGAFRETACRKH